jgi:microcystin-dependent protein
MMPQAIICDEAEEYLGSEDVEFITERDDVFTLTLNWYYCEESDSVYHRPELNEGTGVIEERVIIMAVPIGTVLIWPGAASAIPDGYVLCDGRTFPNTTYPQLFSIIGQSYGGTGSTYSVPRLIGRVPIGLDPLGTTVPAASARGVTGGAATHTLTVAEIPAHAHAVPNLSGGGGTQNLQTTNTSVPNRTPATTSTTGGGAAHNNMPPYLVVNYMIKAFESPA